MSGGPSVSTPTRSFSRIPFVLKLSSGTRVEGELVRHLAPFAIGTILKAKKLNGVLTREKEMIVLMLGLTVGLEKPKRNFKRGAVVLLPIDGSIRFVLSDMEVQRPMNHIGEVLSGIEELDKTTSGEAAELSFQMV
jgi:hypothetical protein